MMQRNASYIAFVQPSSDHTSSPGSKSVRARELPQVRKCPHSTNRLLRWKVTLLDLHKESYLIQNKN